MGRGGQRRASAQASTSVRSTKTRIVSSVSDGSSCNVSLRSPVVPADAPSRSFRDSPPVASELRLADRALPSAGFLMTSDLYGYGLGQPPWPWFGQFFPGFEQSVQRCSQSQDWYHEPAHHSNERHDNRQLKS